MRRPGSVRRYWWVKRGDDLLGHWFADYVSLIDGTLFALEITTTGKLRVHGSIAAGPDLTWGIVGEPDSEGGHSRRSANAVKPQPTSDRPKEHQHKSTGPDLAPGQSLEDFCDAYQKANW